eukprot:TRINITY_DN3177_c0_g1_i1.p1 TRINITY_DN3177_c0_g1~~TRINITY_DN3177_c0_g1_i1.p1  ORF type:complete len:1753 (+),score=281.10 TRINITY_DN3177_c0_g1_i1:58-5316(+)
MAGLFANAGFVLIGFNSKDRAKLTDDIKRQGGNIFFSVSKAVSFVILANQESFHQLKIPRSCSPKIVSASFVRDCLDLNKLLEPDAYAFVSETATTSSSIDASGSWLRIDSLAEAEEAEKREAEAKAQQEAEELAVRRREQMKLAALQPPAVKRIVMGRDGQIKYIYKDNKQIVVRPTQEDHLLTQISAKAHQERAAVDSAAFEEKSKKIAEKKRLKKKKQKLAKQSARPSETNGPQRPSGGLLWAFSVFLDTKAPHSVIGIDADVTRTRGMGPFRVQSANFKSAAAVSVGPSHSAALDAHGNVFVWGLGTKYRLGFGHTRTMSTPSRVSGLGKIVHVACGYTHTAALDSSGAVWIWGSAGSGLVAETPQLLQHFTQGAEKLWCGRDTVAVVSNGALYMWGDNSFGQCGVGTKAKFVSQFKPVHGINDVKDVALGRYHTLVLTANGQVYSFGSGAGGACGTGQQDKYLSPQGPIAFSTKSRIEKIGAGNQRSICLALDGTIYAFGRGELGCPDLLRPFSMAIPYVSSTKFVWLVDCGASTNVMVLDSTMSLFSFAWSSCSFLEESAVATAPEAARMVLPLAVSFDQIAAGFLHGLVLISDARATALQFAMDGDMSSLAEYLGRLTIEQKSELAAFRDGRGTSILHAAVKCYSSSVTICRDIAHLVISEFASSLELLNSKDSVGQSPLFAAVSLAKVDVVKELLSCKGIDVDLQDATGNTPLHIAVKLHAVNRDDSSVTNSLDQIIRALILDGVCSLDARNAAGHNVVDFALSLDAVELAYQLSTFGAPVNLAELRRRELHWWLSIIGTSGTSGRSAWICHANADWNLAVRLQKSLVRSGVKATADRWKFSPALHDGVSVIVFLITESSLRDERCLAELHQSVSLRDGVVLGIVCQDLVAPIPPSLRTLLRRTIYAVPQSRRSEQFIAAASPIEDLSLSSSLSFDDQVSDQPSSELPESVEPVAAAPGPVMETIPVPVFEKVKQMISQLLDQDRVPSRRSSRLPTMDRLLDESKISSILSDPARSFFASAAADRSVRLFVSSTFRDFRNERELLVSHVFPHIERYCLDRQIAFSFVDLRWGITEEQSSSGQVLLTCLREVERSYPYFLCMLGERYGWHDMSDITNMKDELLEQTFQNAIDAGYEWVSKFKDRSVTELEVIHGALRYIPTERMQSFGEAIDYGYNVPDSVKELELRQLNSFFYLRDPSFIDGVKSDQKPIYSAENFLAKHKMFQLREPTRLSELPLKGYRTLESFKIQVTEDIVAAVEKRFSREIEPSASEMENMRHISVARSHLSIHAIRKPLLEAIHRHINSAARIEAPLLFIGEQPGVGLTALMAYASSFYANLNPEKLVLFHFARASEKSTLYFEFMRRAIVAIQSFFKIDQAVPTDKDEIVADFSGWLEMASERGGMVIFIDGLDQMDNVDGAHQLEWIPLRLPVNVRVVLSSSSILSAVRKQSTRWSECISVGLLTQNEKLSMLDKLLSSKSKTLSPGQRHRILTSAECCLPLYLKALLDELTVEGVFETLGQTIDSYLVARDPAELYKLIVDRWCRDFGHEFVKSALAMIFVSRQGISEYELLDVLKCSHADFNRLYMPLKEALTNRNGLLCFSNQLVGQVAVSDSVELKNRKRLAEYFWSQQQKTPSGQELSSRVVAELPHHLRKLGDWEWFYTSLSDMRMFSALYTDEYMYELIAYWREIEEAHKRAPLQQSKMAGQFAYLDGFIDRRSVVPVKRAAFASRRSMLAKMLFLIPWS